MVILHTFLALAGGLATITILSLLMDLLLHRFAPAWTLDEGRPSPGSAFVQIGSTFVFSAAGGFFCARSATGNPLVHVLALGIIMLALSALSALQAKGKLPVWFQLCQVAIAPLGVLAGGLMDLRTLGIL